MNTQSRPGRIRFFALPLALLAVLVVVSATPLQGQCTDCDNDGFDNRVDCDDAQATVYPGAPELCDNRDNDCDTFLDEDLVQACSTSCDTGTSTCRGGLWYECTAKPCCDVTIGPGQPDTNLCPLVNTFGPTVCVLPGTYSLDPGCDLRTTLIATAGPAVTRITGPVVSWSPRIQGFTFTEHPSTPDFRGGDWIGNVLLNGLQTFAGDRSQIVGNRVLGNLSAYYAYSVRDNVIENGTLYIPTESDVARYIDAVGNRVHNGRILSHWTAVIERNMVDAGLTGIGIETDDGRRVRVTGNEVRGGETGILVRTHSLGSSDYLVARNRVLAPVLEGVRITLGVPQNSLQVFDNLIAGPIPPVVGGTNTKGVVLDVTTNISFFPTRLDVIGNTIVREGTGVDLSCLFCTTMSVALTSNVIAFNLTAGVAGNPLQPHTAENNDVAGNLTNWLGIPDPSGTNGNIDADPLFADFGTGDYHLTPSSPGIDRGVPHLCSVDQPGLPRALDGDLDGVPVPDMGAFEMTPEVFDLRYELGPMRLAWDPYPAATAGFDVYSGLISVLRTTGNYSQNPPVCGWPSTDYTVPDAVPVGDALFHHVAPHGAVPGSIGSDSQGIPRPLPAPCP